MGRIDNLTGVRAFAALWVVLYHMDLSDFYHHRLTRVAARGYLGVDVFFVLSGFVLAMVYAGTMPSDFEWDWFRRFVTRRLAKIYPLHLVTLGGAAIVLLAGHHFGGHWIAGPNTAWTATCNVLLLQAYGLINSGGWNSPSRSVSAEWFAYVVMFVPMVLALRRVRTGMVLLVSAGLWAAMLLLLSQVASPGRVMTDVGVVRIIPEFVCGYGLYRVLDGKRPRHGDWWTGAGIVLLAAVAVGPLAMFCVLPVVAMVLLGGLCGEGRMARWIFGNRLVVLLGEASYSIYMTHLFTLIATAVVTTHVHLVAGRGMAWVAAALELAWAAGVGVLTYRKVEEPLRQWVLRRFSAEGRAAGAGTVPAGAELPMDEQAGA